MTVSHGVAYPHPYMSALGLLCASVLLTALERFPEGFARAVRRPLWTGHLLAF